MKLGIQRVALLSSLASALVAGCFSFGSSTSTGNGCADYDCQQNGDCPCVDAGPPVANATWVCTGYVCKEGFVSCGNSATCAVDVLNDPQNCGLCSNVCGSGACTEGSCFGAVVVADGLDMPGLVAAAPDFAYVAVTSGLEAIPRTGGAPRAIQGASAVTALAADGSGVYWVGSDGTLWRASTPTSSPVALASQPFAFTGGVELDADYVYGWPLEGLPDAGSGLGVWRLPKAGGAPLLVGPSSNEPFDSLYFATSEGRVAYPDVQSLRVAPADGGTPRVVAHQRPAIGAVAADATSIYWMAGAAQRVSPCGFFGTGGCPAGPSVPDGIFAVPWAGGQTRVASPTADGLTSPQAAGGALWGLGQDPSSSFTTLVRVDVASTGVHTLFASGGTIGGFALEGGRVFWTRGAKLLSAPQG